jgi:hypothetical protein
MIPYFVMVLTVFPSPSPSLNPKKTLTKLLRNLT